MVQAVGAAVIFVAPEILGIVHVRIVIKAIPIERGVCVTPSTAIGLLGLGWFGGRQAGEKHRRGKGETGPANHGLSPWVYSKPSADGGLGQRLGVRSSIGRRYNPD